MIAIICELKTTDACERELVGVGGGADGCGVGGGARGGWCRGRG